MASPGRPVRPRPPRRHSSGNGKYNGPTLGTVEEDGGMAPDIPPKAHHRQFARMFNIVPFLHFDKDPFPPPYDFENILGPGGEKLADVRQNRHTTSRGGWKRIMLLIVVSILLIIGLIVGLVLGLRARSHDKHNPSNPPESSPSNSFPAGTYSISTFLSTISAACTSNPSTWRCYPYATYAQSTIASLTTFNWIISSSGRSDANFLISSSDNPFALSFANASLTLVDSGLNTEAYAFSVPNLQKVVIPVQALTEDGATDSCYFNNTLFEARLYTKMPKSYPPDTSVGGGGSSNGRPGQSQGQSQDQGNDWPFAVEMKQSIGAGDGVPDCYKSLNGADGEHVGVAATSGNGECNCAYQNFGT